MELDYKLIYRNAQGVEDEITIYSTQSIEYDNLPIELPDGSQGYIPLTTDNSHINLSEVRLMKTDSSVIYYILRDSSTVIDTYNITIIQPGNGTITVNNSETSPQTFNSGDLIKVELSVPGTLLINGTEQNAPYEFYISEDITISANIQVDSKIIAVGLLGTSIYSDNGTTWILSRMDGTNTAGRSICYGNNLYVAGMGSSSIGYSSDGIIWKVKALTTNPNNLAFIQIKYANGIFVALANSYMARSTDGVNWELFNIEGQLNVKTGLAYGDNKWIVTGAAKEAFYSTDNTQTWTRFEVPFTGYSYGLAYANNRFVSVGQDHTPFRSDDGLTWTQSTTVISSTMRSLAYGNDTWVAVGDTRYYGFSKDNGVTWTQRQFANTFNFTYNNVNYAQGKFYVVGNSNYILQSADGDTWTGAINGVTTNAMYAIGSAY